MADNRVYIKCSVCGDTLFIGKSFYDGVHYTNYLPEEGSLEDKLNNFYSEHEHLDDPLNVNLLGTNFYIEHECDSHSFNELLFALYRIFKR